MRYWVTRRTLIWTLLGVMVMLALGGCALPFMVAARRSRLHRWRRV